MIQLISTTLLKWCFHLKVETTGTVCSCLDLQWLCSCLCLPGMLPIKGSPLSHFKIASRFTYFTAQSNIYVVVFHMLFHHRSFKEISQQVTLVTGTLRVGDGGRWPSASATNALRFFHDRCLFATRKSGQWGLVLWLAAGASVRMSNGSVPLSQMLLDELCQWGFYVGVTCSNSEWVFACRHRNVHFATEQPDVKNLCNNETMVW